MLNGLLTRAKRVETHGVRAIVSIRGEVDAFDRTLEPPTLGEFTHLRVVGVVDIHVGVVDIRIARVNGHVVCRTGKNIPSPLIISRKYSECIISLLTISGPSMYICHGRVKGALLFNRGPYMS